MGPQCVHDASLPMRATPHMVRPAHCRPHRPPIGYPHRPPPGVRGAPKTVSILRSAMTFFEKTFMRRQPHLKPAFRPVMTPGAGIRAFSVQHCIGFTRRLASQVLLEAISALNLSVEEFVSTLGVVRSLCAMKFVYMSSSNVHARM